jgi:DNA-binding protein H-NS
VKPTRAPAAAKYRHPENPSLTWSGRGRKPLWFVAALEAGKSADDLAIG